MLQFQWCTNGGLFIYEQLCYPDSSILALYTCQPDMTWAWVQDLSPIFHSETGHFILQQPKFKMNLKALQQLVRKEQGPYMTFSMLFFDFMTRI